MKAAVISDIHANNIALQEVLKDIKNENCDKIYCLGDLILAGPQPKDIIDFVKDQNWTIIQGNTDKLIAEYGPEVLEMMQDKYPIMANAIEDDVLFVDEETKEFLKNLPPQLEENIEGVSVLFVHGSPRRNNEDILPAKPLEEIEEIISDTDADLILCGHTHVPCGYQTTKNQTVVNVGSVGRPMTPTPLACYAVIDFDNGKFDIRHKFVEYDRETAANLVRIRNFEGADKLAQLLINPVERHV